jgi:hypothetical protein
VTGIDKVYAAVLGGFHLPADGGMMFLFANNNELIANI